MVLRQKATGVHHLRKWKQTEPLIIPNNKRDFVHRKLRASKKNFETFLILKTINYKKKATNKNKELFHTTIT
jgi:hypothetical protein